MIQCKWKAEVLRRVIPDLTPREQTPEPVEKAANREAKTQDLKAPGALKAEARLENRTG